MHMLRNSWPLLVALALMSCGSDSPVTPAVDTGAPTVLSIDPAQDDTGAAVDATIRVVFSEDMNPASATGNVSLSSGTISALNWSDARTLEIDHSNWNEAENVAVTLASGLSDVAGNGLSSPYLWDFWTFSSAPMLLESSPADLSTDVNRNSSVALLFSHDMDLVSLSAATSVDDGTAKLPVGFTLENGEGNWVTMWFDVTLPANADINVSISTAAQSNGGANLGAAADFGFRTGIAIDDTPPNLLSISPPNGSSISASEGALVFSFDEPLDANQFEPSSISGQLLMLFQYYDLQPVWSNGGAVLTLNLPTPLPAGLVLAVTFDSYFDRAGNQQTTPIEYRVDVRGEGDPWPLQDGVRFNYFGEWSRTIPGEGTSTGNSDHFVQVEAQPSNLFEWVRYPDDSFELSEERDVYSRNGSAIAFTGFYEFVDPVWEFMSIDPPALWMPLPIGLGSWNGNAVVTTAEGSVAVAYAGQIFVQEDLLATWQDSGMDVIWYDAWKVQRNWTLEFAPGVEDTGAETVWYCEGIGIVRSLSEEHRNDGVDSSDARELMWRTF